MKEILKLPIHIEDIDSVTDCWIYNRLAIIKTSPYYKDWIASHYNLYSDSSNFHFGEVNIYPPSYHEEILQRKSLRVFHMDSSNIIDTLKDNIKNGYYIIMHIKPYIDEDYFHEVLFYGFDDSKQQLISVGVTQRFFQTICIDYSHMEITVEDIKKYYLNNSFRGMELSMNYQYPATAMKLNPSYNPDNCAFEAYLKIRKELDGKICIINHPKEIGDYGCHHYHYIGIACLNAFKEILQTEINGDKFCDWFRGLTSAAKKLYEHRCMIKTSMEYIIKKWKIALTDEANSALMQYNDCVQVSEKWLNLCLKYEFNQDKEILKRIIDEIPSAFLKEKATLNTFLYQGIDWECFNKNFV